MTARGRLTLAWLAIVVAAASYVAFAMRVDADFSAFLPTATTSEQRFLAAQLKEGVASRLLLVELAGDTPERLAAASRALTQALVADGRFRYVNNGDADRARGDLDVLRAHRYALSDEVVPARFGVEGLRAALAVRVRGLASGRGLFEKALLPEDPTGEVLHLVERLSPPVQPRHQNGVWFSPDGARALLLAETRASGSDLDAQAAAIAALQRAHSAARGDSTASIRFSSPGAMAAQSRTLIAGDAARLAIVSTALIVAILGFVYHSPAMVLLCALPALTGLLVGVATVDVAFGGVNAITLAFGATLLGEAVDYPGYLLTQMRTDEPATATLTRIARTLAVAVLTTAAAAVALLLAGFPGLAQLGLLTMVGVLGAGAVTAWVLPSWAPQGRHAAPIAAAMRVPRALPSPAVRISIAAALAIAVLFAAMVRPWWDDDLAHMNPLPKELMQRDGELRAALGAPDVRWMLFVDGATQEEALASAEKVRPILMQAVAAGTLRGFELVSDYLPSNATQRARRAALPASAQLRANLTEAARGLPLRVEAFLPFLDAVERARTAPPVTADDLAGTAIGLKLDGLLRHEGARWYVVVPLTGVLDAAAVENAVAQGGGAAVRWVDLQATSRTMMAEFRERALTAFGVGAILIAAVLVVGLRSVFAAARVLLPVTVAIGVTAAAMVAIGSPLTVFHLVALMLVAGIGTNYALFLARAASVDDPASTTFRSLAVVGSTTLCAFGTLASSQAPALRAIGLTVSLGVIASLVFAVLLWTGHIYPARRA